MSIDPVNPDRFDNMAVEGDRSTGLPGIGDRTSPPPVRVPGIILIQE